MEKKVVPVKGYLKKTGKAVAPHSKHVSLKSSETRKNVPLPPSGSDVPGGCLVNRFGRVIDPHQPFSGVDLSGIVVTELTDWSYRVFIGTDLRGSDLRKTHLNSTTFRVALLNKAILDGVHAENSSFVDVVAQRASFKGSRLVNSSFRGADLRGADFTEANLVGANFKGAQLLGTKFSPDAFLDGKQREKAFDWYSFDEVIEMKGLTPKRFEFFVLSGVVKVRDRKTSEIVNGGFDPDLHYVDAWQVQNSILDLGEYQ